MVDAEYLDKLNLIVALDCGILKSWCIDNDYSDNTVDKIGMYGL